MTTRYDSEREALETGAVYCGYTTREKIKKVLESAEISEQQIGNPLCALLPPEEASKLVKTVKVHTIVNTQGRKVSLAIGKFRGGFDLWLINPETGAGIRT